MTARHYKLLPRQQICLFTGGEDGRHFIVLFRECWKRLPLSARRRILTHWRRGSYQESPIIEFSNMWADSRDSFAQVTNNGFEIRFSASDFTVLPRSVAGWCIAHELAHVYQKAIGRMPGGESEEENEQHADSTAEKWGFNPLPKKLFDLIRHRKNLSVQEASQKLEAPYRDSF